MRSVGSPAPRKTSGAPSTSTRSASGPLPPSRRYSTSAGSLSHAWAIAVSRAAMAGESRSLAQGETPPGGVSTSASIPSGRCCLDPRADLRADVLGSLVGHEPEADLGVRLGRDDRLVAGAGVAAPHAVDLRRRAGADALQGAEARLAGGGRGRGRPGQPLLLVEGHPRHELALPVAERPHLVVEAGQGDPAVRRRAARRAAWPSRAAGWGRRRRTIPSAGRPPARAG